MEEIRVLNGGLAVDDRGTVSFVNDFDFSGVKRFYKIENFSRDVIRAFHGHLKEGKFVYVAAGTIVFAAVPLDNVTAPSKAAKVSRFILSGRKPSVVYVPPGYANGFRVLEDHTQVLFFSTSTLQESQGDDYRFPVDYWGEAVWEVENR